MHKIDVTYLIPNVLGDTEIWMMINRVSGHQNILAKFIRSLETTTSLVYLATHRQHGYDSDALQLDCRCIDVAPSHTSRPD